MQPPRLRFDAIIEAVLVAALLILTAVVSLRAGIPLHAVAPLAYLAAVTPALVRWDCADHRLPNAIVLPGCAIGLIATVGAAIDAAMDVRLGLIPGVAGLAYAGILFVLSFAGGMGMGDVKLACTLGLASWSPPVAVLSPVLAFLGGGLAGLVLLARRGPRGRLAFGPFLLGGFWLAVGLAG